MMRRGWWRRTLIALLMVIFALCLTIYLLSPNLDISELPNAAEPKPLIGRKTLKKASSGSKPLSDDQYQQQLLQNAQSYVYPAETKPRNIDQSLLKLYDYLDLLQKSGLNTYSYCTDKITLEEYLHKKKSLRLSHETSWDRFYAEIDKCTFFKDNTTLHHLLHDLQTAPIKSVSIMPGGTQVKLLIFFENGGKAIFKPLRFDIHYETNPNHFYFSDFERANAEIAAFHLDKVLGFNRAVPTTGRRLNLTEIREKSENALQKTFFVSPAHNLCFVSKCDYYCDTTHAICGTPTTIKGSMQVFLPDDEEVPRDHVRSPYRRTYSKRSQIAVWQSDNGYCDWKVKQLQPYANGRRILDLVDMHILDYLMGNLDRHHYEAMSVFTEEVYVLHLDNGRAFGKSQEDYEDILAPLYQCCMIRPTTLRTLLNFYAGPKTLSESLRASLSADPISPVLADKHYVAIERRLEKILLQIQHCIETKQNYAKVLVYNYFDAKVPADAVDKDDEEDD